MDYVEDEEDEEEAIAKAIAASMRDQGRLPSSAPTTAASAPAVAPPTAPTHAAGTGAAAVGAVKHTAAEAHAHQEALDLAEAEAEMDREDKAAADAWDGEEMVPVPVDPGMLEMLIEMGVPEVRARKGLVHGKEVDGALAWLAEHQDGPVRSHLIRYPPYTYSI
jgi:hypothetical protein